jgi:hypothetical protein
MILEPEAGEELLAAASWYDDQRPGLGDEFLSAIDEVLESADRDIRRSVTDRRRRDARRTRSCLEGGARAEINRGSS